MSLYVPYLFKVKNDCFLLIQVFPFTSSARAPVMNMIIFLKSEGLRRSRIQDIYGVLPEHLFHFAPSLATTFPSLNLTLTPKEQKEEDAEEMGELQFGQNPEIWSKS